MGLPSPLACSFTSPPPTPSPMPIMASKATPSSFAATCKQALLCSPPTPSSSPASRFFLLSSSPGPSPSTSLASLASCSFSSTLSSVLSSSPSCTRSLCPSPTFWPEEEEDDDEEEAERGRAQGMAGLAQSCEDEGDLDLDGGVFPPSAGSATTATTAPYPIASPYPTTPSSSAPSEAPRLTFEALKRIQERTLEDSRFLKRSLSKPELPTDVEMVDATVKNSLWQRVGKKVSNVGRGLLTDENSRILLQEHWLEVADPRHRYGTLLKPYHEVWKHSDSAHNFFHWLDRGEGKLLDLPQSPRSALDSSAVTYLDPAQLFNFLVSIRGGKLVYEATGRPVHTESKEHPPTKWIFVVDPKGKLYIGKKIKGHFHHSSFLAGGTAKVAGNLSVVDGTLRRISRASGHYRPEEEDLLRFMEHLRKKGVDMSSVLVEDYE